MVVTVLCAGFTVVFFVISSVNEAQWKFGEEESTVEISSKKYQLPCGSFSFLRLVIGLKISHLILSQSEAKQDPMLRPV